MRDSRAGWQNLISRRRATPRLLKNVALWLVACGLVLHAAGCRQAAAPEDGTARPQIQKPRTNPPLPAEYAVLAAHLADEHVSDRDEPVLQRDATQVLAECRGALLDLRAIDSADPDITSLTNDARSALSTTITATEEILALPEQSPAWEQFTEGFIRGFLGDISGLMQRADEIDRQAKDVVRLARQIAKGTRQWQTARLLLPRIARKYAGPPVASGRACRIDYDATWGPHDPDEVLTLVCGSTALTNCTVLVELQGLSEVTQNVHFLPTWKSGQTIYARYSPGTDFAGEVILKQSVPDVQRLLISVWADQLSQEDIRYEYAGAEQERDIARYCEPIRLSLEYQPLEQGLIWDTARAVRLRLDGIARLDHPRVTVTFSRGQEQQSWFRDLDRWEREEVITLYTPGGLSGNPEWIEVAIGFPSVRYQHTSVWQPVEDGSRWILTAAARNPAQIGNDRHDSH